jgi:hypothetical protein
MSGGMDPARIVQLPELFGTAVPVRAAKVNPAATVKNAGDAPLAAAPWR